MQDMDRTALMVAVIENQPKIVETLVRNGVDICKKDKVVNIVVWEGVLGNMQCPMITYVVRFFCTMVMVDTKSIRVLLRSEWHASTLLRVSK